MKDEEVRVCAKTGLVVDIYGTNEVSSKSPDGITGIAVRADMDGLPIKENN